MEAALNRPDRQFPTPHFTCRHSKTHPGHHRPTGHTRQAPIAQCSTVLWTPVPRPLTSCSTRSHSRRATHRPHARAPASETDRRPPRGLALAVDLIPSGGGGLSPTPALAVRATWRPQRSVLPAWWPCRRRAWPSPFRAAARRFYSTHSPHAAARSCPARLGGLRDLSCRLGGRASLRHGRQEAGARPCSQWQLAALVFGRAPQSSLREEGKKKRRRRWSLAMVVYRFCRRRGGRAGFAPGGLSC